MRTQVMRASNEIYHAICAHTHTNTSTIHSHNTLGVDTRSYVNYMDKQNILAKKKRRKIHNNNKYPIEVKKATRRTHILLRFGLLRLLCACVRSSFVQNLVPKQRTLYSMHHAPCINETHNLSCSLFFFALSCLLCREQ